MYIRYIHTYNEFYKKKKETHNVTLFLRLKNSYIPTVSTISFCHIYSNKVLISVPEFVNPLNHHNNMRAYLQFNRLYIFHLLPYFIRYDHNTNNHDDAYNVCFILLESNSAGLYGYLAQILTFNKV